MRRIAGVEIRFRPAADKQAKFRPGALRQDIRGEGRAPSNQLHVIEEAREIGEFQYLGRRLQALHERERHVVRGRFNFDQHRRAAASVDVDAVQNLPLRKVGLWVGVELLSVGRDSRNERAP